MGRVRKLAKGTDPARFTEPSSAKRFTRTCPCNQEQHSKDSDMRLQHAEGK